MNYVCFSGTIDNSSVDDFIKETRDMQSEDLTIYFDSNGGELPAACMLNDYINSFDGNVTIKSIGDLASCALMVFLLSNSKKIVKNAYGMHHLITRDVNTRELIKMDKITKIMNGDIEYHNSEYIKFLEKINTPDDIIIGVRNGDDMYIDQKELKREAAEAEKLFYRPKE